MSPSAIVQKLWNYCNVLRDDLSAYDAQAGGMSYGGSPSTMLRAGVEQLTYVLFLKMADEGGSVVPLVPVLVGFLLCASALSCAHVRSSHG